MDEQVWPGGLHRLADHVRARGMQFGLWFEPEMVNPDSDLYRAHPDWILSAGGRLPPLARHQLVLDLTRPEVAGYLLEQISSVLSDYGISYVKWDCNRDIIDAGSGARSGAPAAHAQAQAVYDLLDELSRRHPRVEWESCAGGGGRVDLGILERVQRIWASDMTDALARQAIQRWTGQLVPPEYLGAHVSAPFSHQTGRYMPLSLRCATALFGHFGVEWDIIRADPDARAELAAWIALYKRHRELIHSGLVRRVDTPDDTAWMHGVVAADGSAALMSYVQLEPPPHGRPGALQVPRPRPRPAVPDHRRDAGRAGGALAGPRSRGRPAGRRVSGAVLAGVGLDIRGPAAADRRHPAPRGDLAPQPRWFGPGALDGVPGGFGDVLAPGRDGPAEGAVGKLIDVPPGVLLEPVVVPALRTPITQTRPAACFVRDVVFEV